LRNSEGARDELMVVAALVALGIAAFAVGGYITYIMMYFFAYSVFALSWDLLYSYSGQLSLGHALPFGVGAFAFALLAGALRLNPLASFAAASLVAALAGGSLGTTTLRLRPAYQGVALLVLSQVFYWFTLYRFGDEGISFPQVLGPRYVYATGMATFVVASLMVIWITNSNVGLRLAAIKDDNAAAMAIGIDVARYKILAQFLSAFMAGLGGSFYVLFTMDANYSVFSITNSFFPIAISVLGGMGSPGGVLIGGLLLTALTTFLPAVTSLAVTYLIYAATVFLVLRFYPRGLRNLLNRAGVKV